MEKEKLYNINDIYTGILNISESLGNLLNPYNIIKRQEFHNKKWELINNGALNLNHEFFDPQNALISESIFTLFIKKDDKYVCLHNGKVYEKNYIENLQNYKKSLPKIDFDISEELSLKEIMNYFNKIYNNKECIKLYDKNLHSINDFYIGTLNLLKCTSIKVNNEYLNLVEKELLIHDKYLKLNSNFEYDYDLIDCLFLKVDNKYYCLNDFNFYENKEIIGENFCQNLISLKDHIENDDTFINIKELTIKSANDLYQTQKQKEIIQKREESKSQKNSLAKKITMIFK